MTAARAPYIPRMRRVLIMPLLGVALLWQPAAAQDAAPPAEEAPGLIEEGARTLLRGLWQEIDPALRDLRSLAADYEPLLRDLSAVMGNIGDYEAPEVLENGDILIRRSPDAPPYEPPAQQPDPATGEVEL